MTALVIITLGLTWIVSCAIDTLCGNTRAAFTVSFVGVFVTIAEIIVFEAIRNRRRRP